MKIDYATNQNNKYKHNPSFQAIRIPLQKANYDAMLEAIYTISPLEKIELKRGQTKAGKIVDYVMTNFGSEKENKILEILRGKLESKISAVKNKSVVKNIKRYYEPTAPQGNKQAFGDDSSMTNVNRAILRADIDDILETQSHWDNSSSQREYKKIIDFLKKETFIDDESMALIRDKYKLSGVRRAQKDGFIGEMPVFKKNVTEILTDLKEKSKVENIINLYFNKNDFKNICQIHGFEYTHVALAENLEEAAFISLEEYCGKHQKYYSDFDEISMRKMYEGDVQAGVKNLIKLIKTINKGQYYMGCSMTYGDRTRNALGLNEMFNPLCKTKGFVEGAEIPIEKARIFYKHLTDADKKELGYIPEFEEQLKKRLNIR